MAEDFVQLPSDTSNTGKKMRTELNTVGANSVEQEVVTIADSTGTLAAVGANGLKVDGSSVTQPVSGTFWQATQPVSGTVTANAGTGPATAWKVDLSATAANATAVKVDGSAVTQPVSAATLPLPTGAATAAKQPALGTAGSASADVISVQGIASMTALKVDGSAVTQPVSGTTTANQGTAAAASGAWPAKVTDGTNVAAVKAASTAAVAADPAVVVAVSPNNAVAATQSGTWTVQPGNTANTTAWKVDGSAVTQPVSGTVTAKIQDSAGGTLNSVVKGTQAANALGVQDLKDSGRSIVVLNASGIASVASEALVTMQKYVGGTVTTGVTEYVVTTGKTLRVQHIQITPRPTTPSTTVTFASNTWKLRRGTATLTITSSLVGTATGMVATNVPSSPIDFDIPDGLEFAAADHIGFSQIGTTGMTFDLTLIGYEY